MTFIPDDLAREIGTLLDDPDGFTGDIATLSRRWEEAVRAAEAQQNDPYVKMVTNKQMIQSASALAASMGSFLDQTQAATRSRILRLVKPKE